MARISCTAGYHRTLATACVLQAVLSAPLLHCDVRTGSEIVISFIFHCPLPGFQAVGVDVICIMQSLSKDWICDARLSWGWYEASVKENEVFSWEVVTQDILRRWHEESEQQLSLNKMQKVLQRTFTAFVKQFGEQWLLGLLDMLFFESKYVSNYVVTCLMVVCHEPRFEHVSPMLDVAFAEGGRLHHQPGPPEVG